MSTPPISPSIDVVETFDGVRYILHTSNDDKSNLSLGLAFILRIPVVAGGFAVWFLSQNFRQASAGLVSISVLFILQMVFISRLPWNLFRRRLWQRLMDRFGHGEIELRGSRLFLGSRVGILWSGRKEDVREFERIVVYTYRSEIQRPMETVSTAQPDPERVALAIEKGEKSPWLLVDGFARSETIALADDLHHRLAAAIERFSAGQTLPPPVVIETQQNVLYPPLDPAFYRRRKPWWLAMHVGGASGLGALTAIAVQTGAWHSPATKSAIILGWILEILILGTTLALPGRAAGAENAAADAERAGLP